MKHNGLLAMPDEYLNIHNACTEPCDMVSGPCACGAWHSETDWRPEIVRAAKAADPSYAGHTATR